MRVSLFTRHLIQLNLAMLFISTSGVLGRFITISPPLTIFFRALIAGIFLYLFCRIKNFKVFNLEKADVLSVFFSGLFMGIHWITYFYSLQLSNVAIGMLSVFTYPVITAFLEPLILKTGFKTNQLLLAVLVVVGIYFLVPEFSFENKYTLAVGLGILSAFFYALRNILVKKQISKYQGSVLMWYQLVVVCVLLSPVIFFYPLEAIPSQLPAIIILALLTTAIGHSMYVMSFRFFSVTTASIMGSLQPLYGILLGFVFLREYPSFETAVGGTLILISVILEGYRSYK